MAEDEKKSAGPIRMVAIDNMMSDIRYKGQILARTNKLESSIMDSGVVGFVAGLVVTMVLVILPALALGMI
jgi:tetrahydromethanopterin S-methyltransferase subunit F